MSTYKRTSSGCLVVATSATPPDQQANGYVLAAVERDDEVPS